jgi:hypothetical protein
MELGGALTDVLSHLRRLMTERSGGISLKFAFAIPALAMFTAGAVDLLAVMSAKDRLQAIADAGALAGAPSLSLSADGTLARAAATGFVEAQLSQWPDAPTVNPDYTVLEQRETRAIRVRLEGHRVSFFANLLPPGGWRFRAEATAAPVGLTPLCVLGTGTSGRMIDAVGNARILAPDCGVHSNAQIRTTGAAGITGKKVQAVQSATGGGIVPSALVGAAPIPDPFASLTFPSLNGCIGAPGQGNPVTYQDNQTHQLAPGIHCQPIVVKNVTTLVLLPGEHYFRKNVTLQGNGRLEGDDVFLFFDHGSDPQFSGPYVRVNLVGRKTGPYAGLVMATVGGNQPDIVIPGERVERLLGVVYVRNGFLGVTGNGVAAEDSAWTVVVAKEVRLSGGASIRINADYDGSDVPVPEGVGPNAGGMAPNGTRLVE